MHDSTLRQTYPYFDILIIDDGSTDESIDIIKSFENDSRVTTIFQENLGVIKTRNKAILEVSGEFIVQLDGDDKLHPEFLSWTVPVLKEDKNIGIVFCETELFGSKTGLWNLGNYSLVKQLFTNQIVITALFRKQDFLKIKGGYNECFMRGYEDWDLWLSIIGLG